MKYPQDLKSCGFIFIHKMRKPVTFIKHLESFFSEISFSFMNRFFIKYPSVLKKLYPKRITRLKGEKSIYLTFDDGPVPEITPWVLSELKKYDAKATFFCIGENIKNHTEIFNQLISENHSIGNHTFNHLNGWKTSKEEYLQNTLLAEKEISRKSTKFFRPPYGKIKNSQAAELVKQNYKIVMWDVLSGDFDSRISEENCFKNVIKNASAGSTIVFHDSQKAFKNLSYTLPKVLEYYAAKGFSFKAL